MIHDPVASTPDHREVWRLYQGSRAVGFGKRFGAGMMWSRTGAAYSGRAIPHAIQVRALPLRTLSGSPIFHGDVVSPPGEDADRYLVLGVGDDLLFARAGTSRFVRREETTFAGRRDFVRHGSVLESVHFSRAFDAALRAFAAREFVSGPLAWGVSLAMVAGCIAAGAIQVAFRAGVGPVLTCAGGTVAGWAFFYGWKRLFPESFLRSTASRVADGAVPRTAALFGAAYGAAGTLGLPGVASSTGGIVAGTLAAALFGGCFAMAGAVLAADTLTRRQDEELGLPSELRSFLDLPSAFLRVRSEEAGSGTGASS